MLDPDIAAMLQDMQDNGEPPLFHDATPKIDVFDPDITIRGLLEIWRFNTGSST